MLAVVALIMVLLAAFPTTGIGRSLHRLLVEQPARRLNRITPGRIIFYAAMGAAGLLLFGLYEVEGLRLFSLMAPELILWFGLFDVAVFLDVFILVAALGAAARFRAMRATLAQGLAHGMTRGMTRGVAQIRASLRLRSISRRRAPKARPLRADKTGSADPDPGWAVFA